MVSEKRLESLNKRATKAEDADAPKTDMAVVAGRDGFCSAGGRSAL